MPIPKVIHYCWLSNDSIPPAYKNCMDSWKEKLPEYEFILWDTKRFDITSTAWTKQSFEAQMYACTCDYIRLHAVYNCGGIYLDMDMEVIKSFDGILQNDLILAYENHISKNIEAGCFGAVKGHPYIHACMEYFEGRDFCNPLLFPRVLLMKKSERHDFINPPILPEVMKTVLQASFSSENYPVFTPDFFTAKNVVTGIIETTSNTLTIHHFSTGYHSEEWRETRAWEQGVKARFGEKRALSKLIIIFGRVRRQVKKLGILMAAQYFFNKYIRKENAGKP